VKFDFDVNRRRMLFYLGRLSFAEEKNNFQNRRNV